MEVRGIKKGGGTFAKCSVSVYDCKCSAAVCVCVWCQASSFTLYWYLTTFISTGWHGSLKKGRLLFSSFSSWLFLFSPSVISWLWSFFLSSSSLYHLLFYASYPSSSFFTALPRKNQQLCGGCLMTIWGWNVETQENAETYEYVNIVNFKGLTVECLLFDWKCHCQYVYWYSHNS